MRKKLEQNTEEINPYDDQIELTEEFFLDGLSDYIRAFIRRAIEEAVKQELTDFLGYKPYQRDVKKQNYRNGSYTRDLTTRYGPIEEISIARDRSGEFEPGVIRRYKRREQKIDRDIQSLFIGGISTRRMKVITKALFGKGYSSSTISRINKELTEQMRRWMESPIEDDIVYLFLDGVNLPIRRFSVSKESLLVGIGITVSGHRKVLGVQLGDKESATSWNEFFKDLKRRGLRGGRLKLGVMDGLSGLERAFEESFPRAKIQRCVVHKLRNIASRLPRSIQRECIGECKRIFYASSLEEAMERFKGWKGRWAKIASSAVNCLEKDLETVLRFYEFPESHRVSIRTTNIIERCFKEFRRRTRPMDSFPNEDSCLRCIFMICMDMNDRWSRQRVHKLDIGMEELLNAA
jgi:putative transposase